MIIQTTDHSCCQGCGSTTGGSNLCAPCKSSFEASQQTVNQPTDIDRSLVTGNQSSAITAESIITVDGNGIRAVSAASSTTTDQDNSVPPEIAFAVAGGGQTSAMTAESSVTVGGSVTGEISAEGEVDFISVVLQAGVTYQIDLEGASTASGTLGDPLLTGIFLANGTTRVAAANDDGGLITNSRITFTPTVTGTYLIGASSFNNTNQTDTGTYTLFVDTQENADRPDPFFVERTPTSGNNFIDGLTSSGHYAADTDGVTRVTFSFPGANATFTRPFILTGNDDDPNDDIDLTQSNVPVSAQAAEIFRAGLNYISNIANIQFQEVQENGANFGVLRLSGNNAESGRVLGVAGLPSRVNTAGDIFLFENFIGGGTRLNFVTLHELGHALGLSHPTDEFPSRFMGAEFTLLVPSFQSAFFEGVTSADLFPTTFQYGDILALRHIYGGQVNAFTGDNTYTFDLSNRYFQTIFDLGGTDTIRIIGRGAGVNIDLTPNEDYFGGRFINVGTTIRYFGSGRQIGSRTDTVFVSPETVIENIIASEENDRVIGNEVNNLIEGGGGNDTLQGAAGDDRVRGDAGNDLVQGNAGNDFLVGGTGDDTVSGGSGNDQIFAGSGDTGNDLLIGESGDDILGGGAGNDFIVGDAMTISIDGLAPIENISTAAGNDILFGGAGNDTLIAGRFDDANGNRVVDSGELIDNAATQNTAYAGSGNDLIYGDGGSDVLGGGVGDDTIIAGGGNDTIYGGRDSGSGRLNDVINGGAGNDQIFASGGDDSISGGNGNDEIFGGAGNDTIDGGTGSDDIFNSAGNDIVTAGAGDDTLRANAGNDTLTGGSGNDTFFFAAGSGDDIITDFNLENDRLDISSTATNFTDLASVRAVAQTVTIDGAAGVMLDLGGGDSVFLRGINLDTLNSVNFIF